MIMCVIVRKVNMIFFGEGDNYYIVYSTKLNLVSSSIFIWNNRLTRGDYAVPSSIYLSYKITGIHR